MLDEPSEKPEIGKPTNLYPLIAIVLMPLLLPVIWLFKGLYRLGDLLFDLDKRGANSNLARLTREIEGDYDYLFSEFGGHIVPEQASGNPSFDWASVVVELNSVLLRASRDRGYTDWYITAKGSRYRWQPLDPLCRKLATDPGATLSMYRALKDHLPELEKNLTGEF
jgi:hypothetical protein